MLRTRKNKRYNEETNDEEDDGGRKYNLRDKIKSQRFEQLTDLLELQGDEVTLKLFQRDGFEKPILVTGPAGLDLTAPPKGFVVRDVGKLVGYDRLIDVMDVRTQKNIEMTMKDWCKYYESRSRDRLLNVISLEFSHTDLDELVDSPRIVKLLDWVDLVWPKFLKESQTESTNTIDKMKYPKVQKYCLMSVKGSYTDFHIDFGGTSVWYHIIRGRKIFWMVPPTELNLQTFEEWTLSGMQQDVFFGDTVEECFRVELSAGNTFFIPSGWIHAVYTVEDSLVFGGNFLHSFGIENQLKVSRIEDATKVPLKFRYPFYTEMLWYVVQHYVYCLTGKSHLHNSAKNSAATTPEKASIKATNQSKTNNKRTNVIDDSATESEHDDCDKTTKARKKKAVTPPPPKRKRGRPPKQKPPPTPPTDDESTEVDSDLEDVKPAKSTTCRMTKNSLLRLQYEIDDPQTAIDRQTPTSSTRVSKHSTEPTKNEICSKDQSKGKNSPAIKSEHKDPPAREPNEDNPAKLDQPTSFVDQNETSRLNGWSMSNASASKATWSNPDPEPKEPSKIHITKYELNGLKVLVKYLSKLSGAKKNLPTLIRNSRALLDDCKKVIAEHENDDPEQAVTGIPITPDLLNPKKSDINQLIEQFFKPDLSATDDTSNNNSPAPAKSKSDSSTLTMQQRLKYNQANNHHKVDDKKSSNAGNDSATSHKASAHKETKCLSPSKKSSSSSVCASPNAASNATSAPNSAANASRPKSPPTRPLSNKQYYSKTKSDKSNNGNLVLPGSFADLIAATSSAKEVFNVSSADVTSSLFGSTSPSKSNSEKDAQTANSNEPSRQIKRSPFDIDISKLYETTSTDQASPQKDTTASKPGSPQPPKISPTKRFITPAQNRLQNKEKLIIASAPYVSPVFASTHSRQPHPWQTSTPSHGPQHGNIQPTAHHQLQKPSLNQHYSHNHNQQQPQHHHHLQNQQGKDHAVPNQAPQAIQTPKLDAAQTSKSSSPSPTQRTLADQIDPVHIPTAHVVNGGTDLELKRQDHVQGSPAIEAADSVKQITPQRQPEPEQPYISESKLEQSKEQGSSVGSSLNSSFNTKPAHEPAARPTDSDGEKAKKPHKPRGPPKKSKEARMVIESNHPEPPSQVVQTPIIVTNAVHHIPVMVQSSVAPISQPVPTMSAEPSTSAQPITEPKEKSKPKTKKSKTKDGQTSKDSTTSTPPAGPSNVQQLRPPVISGMVAAPPLSSAGINPTIQSLKPGQQQYLISRPMLYNNMPSFTSAHMQGMVPTSMPIFTTPVPTSMGLPNMQPGARIVWATRPRGMPVVTTAAPINTPKSNPTTVKSKKQTPKPNAVPTNLQTKPPDNAALLSLATTALSTAPLPTTPTLTSTIGARLPSSQTFMINPNMYTQPYFNPYMHRMPMVHFGPRDPSSATASAMMVPGQYRPGGLQRPPQPTASQLLVPVSGQLGQPRYLITQPGYIPQRAQLAPIFAGHQFPTSLPYAAFQPTVPTSTAKDPVKVKKVKTR